MSMWLNESVREYCFGGVEMAFRASGTIDFTESEHIGRFRGEKTQSPKVFQVEMTDELPPPAGAPVVRLPQLVVYRTEHGSARYGATMDGMWEKARYLTERIGDEYRILFPRICYPGGLDSKSLLNAIGTEHLVVEAGGVILHASYINWNGRAILFTAPSGTGKSTQASLWKRYMGAQIVNGDRAVMRLEKDSALAAGIPFAGSSDICLNQTLPLTAVVCLSQAPENTLRQLRGFEAFRRVWEGCSVNTWDNKDVSRASETVLSIIQRVPAYHLACTPDEAAVKILAKKLEGECGCK